MVGRAYRRPGEPAPIDRSRERRARLRSAASSLALHGAVVAVLFLPIWAAPPEPAPTPISVLFTDPGAAGAAGGSAGGGASGHGDEKTARAARHSQPAPDPAEPAPTQDQTADAQALPKPADTTPDPAPRIAPAPQSKPLLAPQPRRRAETKAAARPPVMPAEKPRVRPQKAPAAISPPAPSNRPPAEPPPRRLADAGTSPGPLAQPGAGSGGRVGQGPGGPGQKGLGASGSGSGVFGDSNGPGDDYLDRLRRWLAKHKRYPEEAVRKKEEGSAIVAFTVARDGTVLDAKIERSSGYPLLDRAVLQMLRDSSPVPPLPAIYKGDTIDLKVPISFKLGFFNRLF